MKRFKNIPSFWLACLFEIGILLPALPIAFFSGRPPLADAEFTVRAIGLGVLASLPMLLAFAAMLRSQWPPLVRIQEVLDVFLSKLFRGVPTSGLFLISMAAGIGEETLFRGAIQGALGDWLSPWLGLLVASALFGICHFITPAYAVIATLIGLYLGCVWSWSGNLMVPIVAHGFYDFVALYLYRKMADEEKVSRPPCA